jgi:uncharacterized protein
VIRALVVLLVVLAVGWAAVVLLFRLNETRLVYASDYNERRLTPPPSALALPVERVTFLTADSVRLVAWEIPAPEPSDVWVLICHGNAGNISFSGRPDFYASLRRLGVNILAFDYRGYGESDGVPSEAGLYRDATAAYDYLRRVRHVPPGRIVLFGHSLGSAVAIELAGRVEAAGLIVEGALTSVADRGAELYPFLPLRWVGANRFPSLERIGAVRMPKLFLHAERDEVIPIAHGRRVYERATPPKRFVALGGGHASAYTDDRDRFFGAIGEFLGESVR